MKKEYPSWGAPKLRERLRHRWPEVACPAISTVHAVLDRHGLTITDFAHSFLEKCSLFCKDTRDVAGPTP